MAINCSHSCGRKCWPPMGNDDYVCPCQQNSCGCCDCHYDGPNPGIHPRGNGMSCLGSCGQKRKCMCQNICCTCQNKPVPLPWPLPENNCPNVCRPYPPVCLPENNCESCMDFDCDEQCPFLVGCKHPMTHEEMCRFLWGVCYGRMMICVDGAMVIEPVCCTVRECNEGTIFSLRFRTEKNLLAELEKNYRVTLQFDRWTEDTLCMVQAAGTVQVTGNSACVTVVEVRADHMAGVCYRKCRNACGGSCGNHGNHGNNGNQCGCIHHGGCANPCENHCGGC